VQSLIDSDGQPARFAAHYVTLVAKYEQLEDRYAEVTAKRTEAENDLTKACADYVDLWQRYEQRTKELAEAERRIALLEKDLRSPDSTPST
jgi:chromosome segregation ATPase